MFAKIIASIICIYAKERKHWKFLHQFFEVINFWKLMPKQQSTLFRHGVFVLRFIDCRFIIADLVTE